MYTYASTNIALIFILFSVVQDRLAKLGRASPRLVRLDNHSAQGNAQIKTLTLITAALVEMW